jgi:2,3-bisphosphoglycerate-dependent phosphoglycerate mutase
MRGSTMFEAWAPQALPDRKAPSHLRSTQMSRWRSSSCTPTSRSSTTAPRPACSATSIYGKTAKPAYEFRVTLDCANPRWLQAGWFPGSAGGAASGRDLHVSGRIESALRTSTESRTCVDIAALNVPTGIPLRYDIDPVTLRPITPGGEYLDPEAAKEAAAAVANQGR